jgi:rubrerythrin
MYYSGLEIIEIAIRIEENGQEFYTAAADKIEESSDVKGLFYDLAEKEITHRHFPEAGRQIRSGVV